MNYSSLSELRRDIDAGNLSVADVVDFHLSQIAEKNSDINAFLEVYDEEARALATEVDRKIAEGTAGRLAGMVIAIKDNLCYQGHGVSASSKILENFESLFSSTVVERILAEDAVIIGRTNCDEFAMGSSNENSAFGSVKNPLDTSKVPGGSSGGSAAAVAANMCQVALGTDTGGSIRQPASFTGLVGHKPTYGRVSRHGVIAYASSFDQVGPLAKSVEDAALVTEVMSGADSYDSTLSQKPVEDMTHMSAPTKKLKIAYIEDCLTREGLDPEVKAHVEQTIEKLKAEGHEVSPVSFPYLDYLVPIYYILTTAEASSNLARYDGVHAGYRADDVTDLESVYKKSRSEGFGTEVKRRIMLGTFVLSSGYYDAFFGKGQKARRFVQEKTDEILNEFDFILTPTSPHTAFERDLEYADPTVMYLEDIFTVQANITGNPAISIPTGTHTNGLPFGVQLMNQRFGDGDLFGMAKYVEGLMAK
ncbi:MAG: Asp-tRNA(Asn)/Glu-tRNA(Gln) amidotransferase subunit GatA [Schleiferiaceae bacterium]